MTPGKPDPWLWLHDRRRSTKDSASPVSEAAETTAGNRSFMRPQLPPFFFFATLFQTQAQRCTSSCRKPHFHNRKMKLRDRDATCLNKQHAVQSWEPLSDPVGSFHPNTHNNNIVVIVFCFIRQGLIISDPLLLKVRDLGKYPASAAVILLWLSKLK